MFELVPLDLVDNILLDYHAGHVLMLVFILSVVGTLPMSRKVFSLNVMAFGLLFVLIPTAVAPFHYKLVGLLLLVIGPVIYTTARR